MTMKLTILNPRFLFLNSLLVIVAISWSEAVVKNRSHKKVHKEKDINVCDIEKDDTPLYCYCDDNQLASATDAKCVIFSKLELSDPIWAHFNSQMYVKKLTFIVRSDGSITYVPTAVIRQLKNLHTVSFENAKLDAIESQSFASLPTVSTINLNKNSISVLKWHAFEGLRNLSVLNLDENFIAELSRDIFYDVPKLVKLYLNHNNVSLLHDKAFKHLPALQELELSNNKISVITTDSFQGLDQLQRLDLRSNLISMLGERCFSEMPMLQELSLDQNKIKYISNRALDGLKNLKKLRLGENKLVTLESDFLLGAPSINLLDLRDNALRTMTFENIKPVITNFYNNSSFFYLNGNKLICDCKLAWIWGLRNETKNPALRETLETLTCFLDASYETKFDSSEDFNRALEIMRNTDSFHIRGSADESYMGDNYDEEYENDYENAQVGHQIEIDGKKGYVRHLFELKPEQLPCPAPTREEMMASEQPSGRRDHGSSSSIFSFSSGGERCTGLLVAVIALTGAALLT